MRKVNWPIAYIVAGIIDAIQFGGDFIPGVDFFVAPANEFIDVAVGAGIAWWAKRIGVLDLGSGAAIGVTFLIEEATAGGAPFWIGDIGILHLKYKAKQAAEAGSLLGKIQSGGPVNRGDRREPTGRPQPLNRGGSRRPM